MGNRIKIDQLATEVMKGLTEYADMATDDMKSAVRRASNSVKNDIQSSAPKDTGKYGKSWTTKTTKETANALEITVHSKNKYQMAHLLEFGHAKRGGGRTKAQPHIAPAEERGIETLEREIEKALR